MRNNRFSAPLQPPIPIIPAPVPSNSDSDSAISEKPDWLIQYESTGVLPDLPFPSTTKHTFNDPVTIDSANHDPELPVPANESPRIPSTGPAPELNNTQALEAPPLRRSTRIRKPSRRALEALEGLATHFDEPFLPWLVHTADIRVLQAIVNHIPDPVDKVEEQLHTYAIRSATANPDDSCDPQRDYFLPHTYTEAVTCKRGSEWRQAIHKEVTELIRNGTFRVIDQQRGMRLQPLKWVFKIKQDGMLKARLVVQGFHQRKGVDFNEIYAAVAKPMSFKIFIALAARGGWLLWHIDIITAFLHALLKESIYVHLPDGLKQAGKCALLMKTLYGLKQSPREWYQLMHDFLLSIGFKRTHADHSVFTKQGIALLLYVDDILLLSHSKELINDFLSELGKSFKYTDNGEVSVYLGINVVKQNDGIFLHQSDYIQKILKRFGLANCHHAATPYNDKEVLTDYDQTASKDDILLFQEMIGSLTWLMLGTRPDIAFAVSKLARFARNPGPYHFVAVKRVFRYLAGTLSLALFYPAMLGDLNGFVDADWAGPHAIKSISTSGYVFLLGNSPISWCSKHQTSVALSSTESEYIAMALAAQEVIWLILILRTLCP